MQLIRKLGLTPGMRVLDLGGQPEIWQHVDTPLDILIVNLPGEPISLPTTSHHSFKTAEGDATDMPQFGDNQFDCVFSNSVIEHVGDLGKRTAFAREVRRLAPRYFVQTPSMWFPLEPHSGIPFWWALPESRRKKMIERWRKTVPPWAEMVEGATVLKKKELRRHFPDSNIYTERLAGFPKSYVAIRTA